MLQDLSGFIWIKKADPVIDLHPTLFWGRTLMTTNEIFNLRVRKISPTRRVQRRASAGERTEH